MRGEAAHEILVYGGSSGVLEIGGGEVGVITQVVVHARISALGECAGGNFFFGSGVYRCFNELPAKVPID